MSAARLTNQAIVDAIAQRTSAGAIPERWPALADDAEASATGGERGLRLAFELAWIELGVFEQSLPADVADPGMFVAGRGLIAGHLCSALTDVNDDTDRSTVELVRAARERALREVTEIGRADHAGVRDAAAGLLSALTLVFAHGHELPEALSRPVGVDQLIRRVDWLAGALTAARAIDPGVTGPGGSRMGAAARSGRDQRPTLVT